MGSEYILRVLSVLFSWEKRHSREERRTLREKIQKPKRKITETKEKKRERRNEREETREKKQERRSKGEETLATIRLDKFGLNSVKIQLKSGYNSKTVPITLFISSVSKSIIHNGL